MTTDDEVEKMAREMRDEWRRIAELPLHSWDSTGPTLRARWLDYASAELKRMRQMG